MVVLSRFALIALEWSLASCGAMVTSLWDKQPLREEEGTFTNQCVLVLMTPKGLALRLIHILPLRLFGGIGLRLRG